MGGDDWQRMLSINLDTTFKRCLWNFDLACRYDLKFAESLVLSYTKPIDADELKQTVALIIEHPFSDVSRELMFSRLQRVCGMGKKTFDALLLGGRKSNPAPDHLPEIKFNEATKTVTAKLIEGWQARVIDPNGDVAFKSSWAIHSDSWLVVIDAWLRHEAPKNVTIPQILEHALGIHEKAKWDRRAQLRVGACLRQLGYVLAGREGSGERLRFYKAQA